MTSESLMDVAGKPLLYEICGVAHLQRPQIYKGTRLLEVAMFFDDLREQTRTVVKLCHVTGRGGGQVARRSELGIRLIRGYNPVRRVWLDEDPTRLQLALDFQASKQLYDEMKQWVVGNLKPFNGGAHYYRPTGWVNPSKPE